MNHLTLFPDKKLYFLSDLHLGAQDYEQSLVREKTIVRFLQHIKDNAQAVYFIGDIFDFWFEYGEAVPKYFIRFLAKIAELREEGIDVYFFKGNHDLWMKDYFSKELGVQVIDDKMEFSCRDQLFLLTHGDAKGPGDRKYKVLKKIFINPICRFLFRWLHPDIGIKIAHLWSRSNYTDPRVEKFMGEEKEWLIRYAREKIQTTPYHYLLMGHRHLPMDIPLNDTSRYINLGDWIVNNTYAVFDGEKLELLKFEN